MVKIIKSQTTNSKSQISSNNEIPIPKTNKTSSYDLEERTYKFAKNVALYCKKLPKTTSNLEYTKQAVKSSGSAGANYIEANESLSRKDFIMRLKISRKESKESAYWLRLIIETNLKEFIQEGLSLRGETTELKKIFSSIIDKA